MDTVEFNKACWATERDRFRSVIASAVNEQLDWQPDPKSRTTRRLIGHMIGHIQDLIELADDGVINHRNEVPVSSVDQALETFDKAYDEMLAKLGSLDAETWAKPADFKLGDTLIVNAPVEQLSWLFFFDSLHHRGQLSTHLRPTGGKVPALYGPSADFERAAH